MTQKQKIFADEYLIDLNATRAYMAVYKNCKTEQAAAACASKLLRNAKVKKYIDEQIERLHSEKLADVREVLEHLTSVMRGEAKEEILIGIGGGVQNKTDIFVSIKDRLKAAELIGRYHGMFTDKVDVNGAVKIVFSGEGDLDE